VRGLRVSFPSREGWTEVVRGLSFDLGRERLAIVGESGSGKSQTGRAILGLTPPPGRVTARGWSSTAPTCAASRPRAGAACAAGA
jgi:peptide/nickel transport system ATP-binding protein